MAHAVAWHMTHLRAADFPTSVAGKGHDTAVVCRWLQKLLTCDLELLDMLQQVLERCWYFYTHSLHTACVRFLSRFTWPSMTCCFQA